MFQISNFRHSNLFRNSSLVLSIYRQYQSVWHGARMVFWLKTIFLQKILSLAFSTTYIKKPLVVGVPFSHGSCTFAPYMERWFFCSPVLCGFLEPASSIRHPAPRPALLQPNICGWPLVARVPDMEDSLRWILGLLYSCVLEFLCSRFCFFNQCKSVSIRD